MSVVFPPKSAATPPEWLKWSLEQWRERGDVWNDQLNELLGTERVLQRQFSADDRVRNAELAASQVCESLTDTSVAANDKTRKIAIKQLFAQRVCKWRELTRESLREDSVQAPNDSGERWLLFHRTPARLCRHSDGSIECLLCCRCAKCLSFVDSKGTPAPKMPKEACANSLWQGPEPQEIRDLTWAERLVLRLARVYCTVKRVPAQNVPWARGNPDALPQYTTRNVVAFLQDPNGAVRTLCLLPEQLSKEVYLQFEGSDPGCIAREPAVQVDVQKLRHGIWWYATHCYQWLEATKDHELFGFNQLGSELEKLLDAYRKSLHGKSCGVPDTLSDVATQITPTQVSVQHRGPADVEDSSCTTADSDDARSDDGEKKSTEKRPCRFSQQPDSSMVVSSSGLDEIGPLSLWAKAIEKWNVLNQLKVQYDAAESMNDEGGKQAAVREEAYCLAEAVHALHGLASSETRKTLRQFHEQMQGSQVVLPVGHDTKLLDTFIPEWWVLAFTDLFFRGDFRVPKGLSLRCWGNALIKRMDFSGWMNSKEFAATVRNIVLRRAQMWNVHKYLIQSKHAEQIRASLQTIDPADFVRSALAAGDCHSIRQALCKKNVSTVVKDLLKSMDVVLRGVEGSESERDMFRFKFVALHLWSGCSLLFFTLNPHDIKNPLLLVFLDHQGVHKQRISLDWNDEEMAAHYEQVKKGNRHKLHEFATQYPAAAARCVHWTFENTLEILFNCSPAANVRPAEMHTDGIFSRCDPGLVGHLSSFLGIVEPQMRQTEHLHALIQVLGFSNPRQYFKKSGNFLHRFREVWSYVANVTFTSQEAAALQLHPSKGLQILRSEPLMPVVSGQLSKIGRGVAEEYLQCQRAARGLDVVSTGTLASATAGSTATANNFDITERAAPPCAHNSAVDAAACTSTFPSWTPHAYGDISLSADDWGKHAIRDCNRGSIRNANHVCRASTCYKGKWQKRRFCRMYYWRWGRVINKKGKEVTKRMHGCALAPRWNGEGLPPVVRTPPNQGAPALERNHGFHGKVMPGVMLGPRCNHDLRPLIHLPVLSEELAASIQTRATLEDTRLHSSDSDRKDATSWASCDSTTLPRKIHGHAGDGAHAGTNFFFFLSRVPCCSSAFARVLHGDAEDGASAKINKAARVEKYFPSSDPDPYYAPSLRSGGSDVF